MRVVGTFGSLFWFTVKIDTLTQASGDAGRRRERGPARSPRARQGPVVRQGVARLQDRPGCDRSAEGVRLVTEGQTVPAASVEMSEDWGVLACPAVVANRPLQLFCFLNSISRIFSFQGLFEWRVVVLRLYWQPWLGCHGYQAAGYWLVLLQLHQAGWQQQVVSVVCELSRC